MKATTIASTVSRCPSLAVAGLRLWPLGARLARWRRTVPSSVFPLLELTGSPMPLRLDRLDAGRDSLRRLVANLANVTDSARIGNPANRPPEDLEGHELARADAPGTACPRTSTRARPALRSRTANRWKPGCCRPARSTRRRPASRLTTSHAAGAACWPACRCNRCRDRSETRSTSSSPPANAKRERDCRSPCRRRPGRRSQTDRTAAGHRSRPGSGDRMTAASRATGSAATSPFFKMDYGNLRASLRWPFRSSSISPWPADRDPYRRTDRSPTAARPRSHSTDSLT